MVKRSIRGMTFALLLTSGLFACKKSVPIDATFKGEGDGDWLSGLSGTKKGTSKIPLSVKLKETDGEVSYTAEVTDTFPFLCTGSGKREAADQTKMAINLRCAVVYEGKKCSYKTKPLMLTLAWGADGSLESVEQTIEYFKDDAKESGCVDEDALKTKVTAKLTKK